MAMDPALWRIDVIVPSPVSLGNCISAIQVCYHVLSMEGISMFLRCLLVRCTRFTFGVRGEDRIT